MQIDWSLVATIAAPIIALGVGAWLDSILEKRAKLLTYVGHVSSFTLRGQAGSTTFNTHSVVVRNAGRRPATNVRLGHNYMPDFQLSPSVQCTSQALPSGGHEIVIPTLVPDEQVTISYVYFPPVVWSHINSYVKSDEGLATEIKVLPTRQYPKWAQRALALLVLVGLTALIYVSVVLLSALL